MKKELLEINAVINASSLRSGKIPVFPRLQTLPLTDLPWKTFEQLCCRIAMTEPDVSRTHLYGVPGDDQQGIDVVVKKYVQNDEQTWCIQCKNHQYFSPGEFETAIRELEYQADRYVFCLACEAKSSLRKIEKQYNNIELWDLEDISRKLKNLPHIVGDFFHPAWIEAFCTPDLPVESSSIINTPYRLHGVLYGLGGAEVENARIKAICDDQIYDCSTAIGGSFFIPLRTVVTSIHIIASCPSDRLSSIKEIMWNDVASDKPLRLTLTPELEVKGFLKWCGSKKPIDNADIMVRLLGNDFRLVSTKPDGSFTISIPKFPVYRFSFTAPGVANDEADISFDQLQGSTEFLIAKTCSSPICETVIVERICDDLEIVFVEVPSGFFNTGHPDSLSLMNTNSFYIGQFPVTNLQYSYYLQYNSKEALPLGWKTRFPVSETEQHPVTGITWHEANKFCQWLTQITKTLHRLPSCYEWEKASRGIDGRIYPWSEPITIESACNSLENGINRTTVVNNYSKGKSVFGVWDTVGNVWEWTSTSKDIDELYIVKGGSYFSNKEEISCYTHESFSATKKLPFIGFRILKEKGQ